MKERWAEDGISPAAQLALRLAYLSILFGLFMAWARFTFLPPLIQVRFVCLTVGGELLVLLSNGSCLSAHLKIPKTWRIRSCVYLVHFSASGMRVVFLLFAFPVQKWNMIDSEPDVDCAL